jgi:uncharacterized repeat protein (TIGR01451 family)
LGNGTYTDSSTAVQVSGLIGVVAIAGGYYHGLALKSDGTVRAWGYNGYGELGDGSFNSSSTSVQVSDLSGVVGIAAGFAHSLAVKSDGTLWAWGNNGNGELGDGSFTSSSTPVQIGGLAGVLAVAAGEDHSVALKSNGTMWIWGWNGYGQLGNGTYTDSSTPTQVSGLTGVLGVAAGAFHSLAGLPEPAPAMSIAKSHNGAFTQGQQGSVYMVTVTNGAAAGPTSGMVTVTDTVPTGWTLVTMSGAGWICSSNTCTRNDVLAPGGSYPLLVTVNVASNAPSQVTNQASVSGGGSPTASASDLTNVAAAAATVTNVTSSTANGTYGAGSSTNVRDIAGEQKVRCAPIHAVIVCDFSGLDYGSESGFFPPHRI